MNCEGTIEKFDLNNKECTGEYKTDLNLDDEPDIIMKASKTHLFVANKKNNKIKIFDCLENEKAINTFQCNGDQIQSIKLVGNQLFVASKNSNKNKDVLEFWNLENTMDPKPTKKISLKKSEFANSFKIHENIICKYTKYIVDTFTLLNIDSGQRLLANDQINIYSFVKIDGKRLFKGCKQIEIWDIEQFKASTKPVAKDSYPKKVKVLWGHKSWIRWVQVAGHLLITGTRLDKKIKVWDTTKGECLLDILSPTKGIKLAYNRIFIIVPPNEIPHEESKKSDKILIYDYNN